ncbi:MAG: DUF1015 family protein [Planctomycetota bacterium]|jgi:uncharacterized protein (DUF1015 family)|nr:DUF1015 family protein [Planctomycetota bacterium]
MPAIEGITGLRPDPARVADVASPPYDVIKPGSGIESLLKSRADSLYHVILGDDPVKALETLQGSGALISDDEACFYVMEQRWSGGSRLGVYAATATKPYDSGFVRRHEKTFDHKVKGRVALTRATSLTIGPVFLLTKQPLDTVLAAVIASEAPLYDFSSDFGGHGDLHGIATRVWRVPVSSTHGGAIASTLGDHPLYIADGHHRYHAALLNGQSHALTYITSGAEILGYDRVVRGTVPFADIKDQLKLTPVDAFVTPPKHQFCLYHQGQAYLLAAQEVPDDVVGGLDCSILERELYGKLGLSHDMIMDSAHFDYYPESELDAMQAVVDDGSYDLAIALHPVAVDQLMAVADAGLEDQDVVMPEKSTFFAPKILTGLVLYRHR